MSTSNHFYYQRRIVDSGGGGTSSANSSVSGGESVCCNPFFPSMFSAERVSSNSYNDYNEAVMMQTTSATTTTTNNKTDKALVGADDKLLARELNDLTFEEREKVYEEIHGVAKPDTETTEFINDSIQQLKDELSKLSRSKRRALDRAFFLKPSLANDMKFMVMFLRADCYDGKKAAQRMGRYFTNKLELFGEDKLVKDITLEDLQDNPDDMECFWTGSVQTLREKDRGGRKVLFVAQMHYKYKHWKNHTRYMWYEIMCALEDEDTQIRGLVDVVYCVGMDGVESKFSDLVSQGAHMLNDLPFRLSALHFCYSDTRLRPALSLIQMVLTQHARLRFRIHFGSNIEVQYALMTFGIPKDALTINPDGSLKDYLHMQHYQERKQIEAERKQQQLERQYQQRVPPQEEKEGENATTSTTTSTTNKTLIVEYPGPNDVLLGRGRPYQEYVGNLQLVKRFVDVDRTKYHLKSTDRFEKTCLSMDVVKKVQDIGGRFLQRIPDIGWEEVDDIVAREKVSHTFRTKPTTTSSTNVDSSTTASDGSTKSSSDNNHNNYYHYPNNNNNNKRIRYDEEYAKQWDDE